ncbi:MAG: MBL fold metallo-hydrolase [Chloroflexi bacterium]|nr:MBL fold metallo-hydrolase [Chloroflexota bacterium]
MYFKQFSLDGLACQSYFIGDDGAAVVVDPQRDVDMYIAEARERGFAIKHIVETHIHADHVSGNTELAARTGATVYLPAKGGGTFPHAPLGDGDEIRVGAVTLKALFTPGHTPEHIALVVTDASRANEPWFALTGDFLFVGDVGRPDLLGANESRALATQLYDSLHSRLLDLPDGLEVYPGHGAGSLCGRAMSAKLSTTVGFERRFNYALQVDDRQQFVHLMTSDLPTQPPNVPYIKRLNREGPPVLGALEAKRLNAGQARRLIGKGAVVVDTRSSASFGAGHARGALNVHLSSGQFSTRLGFLVSPESPVIFVARNEHEAHAAMVAATRVGLDRHAGFLTPADALGLPQASLPQMTARHLHGALQKHAVAVLDVREKSEYDLGHVPGAQLIPLGQLPARISELPADTPVAIICGSGQRSSSAASHLLRHHNLHVTNVVGGFDAWAAAGLPVEK